MKNWFGWPIHPSDELIHWSDIRYKDGVLRPETEKDVRDIRAAWDLVHATPELARAFKLLYDAHATIIHQQHAEDDAGIDL